MSAPTTVTPLEGPNWLAEATAILQDEKSVLVIRREHLLALQAAVADTARAGALMNRALCALLVDQRQPSMLLPAGLVAAVERSNLDITVELQRGSIVVTLLKPTPRHQIN